MSHAQNQEIGMTVYSDKTSMSNGARYTSDLVPVEAPQIESEERGLVPQSPQDIMASLPMGLEAERPAHPLFDGWRIFVNAPQYHWHVYGAEGVDRQARDYLTALAVQMHEFGCRTEGWEQELW